MNLTNRPLYHGGDCVLSVENFSKDFVLHEQNTVIPSAQDVNLKVFEGALTALIGPTGAGKSSVLKSIYRSYLTTCGVINYRTRSGQSMDLALASEHEIMALRREEISFVTQFLYFLPRQASEDVVAQPLVKKGESQQVARDTARHMLARMNLPERLWGISPATFSGGEKQRVNLARGLVARPRLLLLDEPTASLDPLTAECVIDIIEELKHDGVAMLAIFHQPTLVERLAEHVVEMTAPKVIATALEEIA